MTANPRDLAAIAQNIRMLILDVDGVMTDGGIILDNSGNEVKRFHVRDGHGIKMLGRAGVIVAIVTGRTSKVVERRAAELGIVDVYQSSFSKLAAYRRLLEKYGVVDREVAYVGDDIVDIPVLKRVGLPVAVADATDEAKACARFVTANRGGQGAVREVTDLILKGKGLWDAIIDEYYST